MQEASLPPNATPKDEYDLAYGYVLQKNYGLAAQTFRDFLHKYPSDRLTPDAQYWLGESLFDDQKYHDAAEAFLAVSTKYGTSAKAPDALLRLGQSLAALGEKEAACASLGEVLRKYPHASISVKQGVTGNRSVPTAEHPIRDAEANALFSGLENLRGLMLAVSGGPDSTALLVLAARWAKARKARAETSRRHRRSRPARGGGRRSGGGQAARQRLGVTHRTLRWRGRKPKSGLQEAAREARYRLLGASRRARRLRAYPDRAHARRSGGNGAVPSGPRQRTGRPCRHGACRAVPAARAGHVFSRPPAAAHSQGAADRDARSGRRPL